MSYEIGLYVAAIVLLILLSAFFNGSETALTAASRARLHALEQDGHKRARLVNRILASPEKMIGAVLLGNTLVDVLAAALAANLAVTLAGEVGIAYATIVLTPLIVIFAAVLPKTCAIAEPDRFALVVAPLMRGIIWLLTPFTIAIELIVRVLLRLTPSKADDAANILARQEELRGTIDLSHKEGAVGKGDVKMLGGVLDLRELKVADVMVHRTKMETINAGDAPAKIVEEVVRSKTSRLPVWKDQPENIVAVLHSKDLLAALAHVNWDVSRLDVMSFTTPPWFVPDSTSLRSQLNAFLRRKAQLALVVDEYGEVQGLVTLEDILEEIVGQIADEHDVPDSTIRPQPDGSVLVDGTVPIRDLNRQMDWTLPDAQATTIAGLVIHEAETIPEPGQVFTFYGYRIEIVRKSRNKVSSLLIRPVPAEPGAEKAGAEGDTRSG